MDYCSIPSQLCSVIFGVPDCFGRFPSMLYRRENDEGVEGLRMNSIAVQTESVLDGLLFNLQSALLAYFRNARLL